MGSVVVLVIAGRSGEAETVTVSSSGMICSALLEELSKFPVEEDDVLVLASGKEVVGAMTFAESGWSGGVLCL